MAFTACTNRRAYNCLTLKLTGMKKSFSLLCISLFMLATACQKDDYLESPAPKPETKSGMSKVSATADIKDPIDQIEGIPVYLVLPAGVAANDDRFLTAHSKNGSVLLFYWEAAQGGRQKWLIDKGIPSPGEAPSYRIRAVQGDSKGRNILVGGTAISDTQLQLGLQSNPHQSTSYRWSIMGNNRYTFRYLFFYYLQGIQYNNNSVGLINAYSPTNNMCFWEVRPVENFTLKTLTYTLEANDNLVPAPNFMEEVNVYNGTAITQSMTASFTRKASETSHFSKTNGLSVTLSTTAKVGVPILINGQLTVSTTTSQSWTFGTSETQEDTRNYSFPLMVSPHSSFKARVTVAMYNASATYIATYVGQTTGRELILTGKWEGIKAGNVSYSIFDETGQEIKRISGTPVEPVIL